MDHSNLIKFSLRGKDTMFYAMTKFYEKSIEEHGDLASAVHPTLNATIASVRRIYLRLRVWSRSHHLCRSHLQVCERLHTLNRRYFLLTDATMLQKNFQENSVPIKRSNLRSGDNVFCSIVTMLQTSANSYIFRISSDFRSRFLKNRPFEFDKILYTR